MNLNIATLNSSLRSRLMARQLHYNVYTFQSGEVVISSAIRGRKSMMTMMYMILLEDDKIRVSGYGWSSIVNNEDSAVAKIVKDIRKYELRFNKYLN